MKLQLLYFIGLKMMSIWSTEHWATGEKKSLSLFFSLIMKKILQKATEHV